MNGVRGHALRRRQAAILMDADLPAVGIGGPLDPLSLFILRPLRPELPHTRRHRESDLSSDGISSGVILALTIDGMSFRIDISRHGSDQR